MPIDGQFLLATDLCVLLIPRKSLPLVLMSLDSVADVVCSLRRGLATSSIDPLPPKSTLPYSQHHFFRIKSNISRDSIHHNHSPQSHKNHPFTSMAGHNHPVLVRHFRHHRHPIPSFLSDRADLPTLPY